MVPVPEAEVLPQGRRPFGPQVELINLTGAVVPVMQPDGSWLPQFFFKPGTRCLTPSPFGWDDPLHWDPVKRALEDMCPVPKNHKGEWYSPEETLSCRNQGATGASKWSNGQACKTNGGAGDEVDAAPEQLDGSELAVERPSTLIPGTLDARM